MNYYNQIKLDKYNELLCKIILVLINELVGLNNIIISEWIILIDYIIMRNELDYRINITYNEWIKEGK